MIDTVEDAVALRTSKSSCESLLLARDVRSKLADAFAKASRSLFISVQGDEKNNLVEVLAGNGSDVVLDNFILGASANIFVKNLKCVRKGKWLNSDTVNVYVLMIEAAAKSAGLNVTSFNSYFVSKIEIEVTRLVCGVTCDVQ